MEEKKSGRCFREEFKVEAVRQVTECGHPVAEVAARLGVSTYSLYVLDQALFGEPGSAGTTGRSGR